MANSPTVVIGQLNDDELKKSIDKLVANVDEGLKTMQQHTTEAVKNIERTLKNLGNVKIDSGGAADGGAPKRTKAQQQETEAVEKTTAARDKQLKKNQEVATSYDQMAAAQKKVIDDQYKLAFARANKIPTDSLDLAQAKLERLQALLRDMRERGILSNSQIASTEAEIRRLLNIIGQVEQTQQQTTQSAHRYTEEIRRQAQAIRESKEWQEKGRIVVGDTVYYDKERANVSKRDKQLLLSLEEQILQVQQKEEEEAQRLARAEQQKTQAAKQTEQAVLGTAAAYNTADQAARNSLANENLARMNRGTTASGSVVSAFQSYDDLRAAIAAVLKVEQQQVQMADTETASTRQLAASLKQLQDAYSRLSRTDRNSEQGKTLRQEIQLTEREIQKLRSEASRPINLDNAKNLSEKTLDDMAYKLRMLQSYKMGLNVKTQVEEMKQVDIEIVKLKKNYDELMSKNQQMIKSNTALGRSWNYMKNRLAFYFTVGASTAFVKNLIEIRSQYEMNERALGILINSAERGSQIFQELSQMALMSPYTLIELSTAAKQLTAYDVAAKDVVDTTRRLADMTAAVGIPIERLTYAIGQVKAYGYLNARDARMFSNAGIPLVKELANYYTQLEGRIVSVSDVYDKIKKKAIDYNSVMSVVTKMTDEGGKFFDFQAKMAGTLKVQLANLTLAWNNMLNDIGASEQGLLSGFIGGLKELFLQWRRINDIITKVAYAFGVYKASQLVVLLLTGRITTAMGVQELVGAKLQARLAGLKGATIGLSGALRLLQGTMALILVDMIVTAQKGMDTIYDLNKAIADGAKESAEAIGKMLESTEMANNRLAAQTGKLPKADAEKTWEVLREQIELSSMSAGDIIPKLLLIKDANQRLTAAFDVAERIKETNEKLGDMFDSLRITQNSPLGGLFGEGLVEDIDDYNQRLQYLSNQTEFLSKKNRGFWENAAFGLSALFNEVKDALGDDMTEAQSEIENFAKTAANTIKDELGAEGIKDKIQVNEAIARIVQGMEKQFPEIRGKGKVLFETIFNDVMANEFSGAVDKQAYYYNMFLNQLKKDHASAFQQVTDSILDDTHEWSSAQIDAIEKTANKVKKDLPEASQSAIDTILAQLSSTEFKIRIVTQFATTSDDDVIKAFRKKFIEESVVGDEETNPLNNIKTPWNQRESNSNKREEREKKEVQNMQKYGTLMKKTNESDLEYQKRIRDEKQKKQEISEAEAKIIAKNAKKEDEASKAILKNATESKKAADNWLAAADEVEKWGGYDFTTKKDKKDAKTSAKEQATAEKEVSEALKQELSLIKDMQSNYDKMRKSGVDNVTAIELATQGYEDTLTRVNATLQKYGISKFNAKDFLGKDVNAVLRTLEKQRSDAIVSGKLKTGALKDLDVEIQKLNVEAKTYNMDKITKGLNNELSKLKDEYELAVELDANPELGNMFTDMFGIDTSDFPKTIDEYMGRVQSVFNKETRNLGYDATLNVFKASAEDWRSWAKAVGLGEEALKNFNGKFVEAQGVAKKWAQDTIKQTKDLQYKLADTNGKIAIEEEKLAQLKQRLAKETNEEQKRLLDLQIQDQQNAINKLKEDILQLLPTYSRLFGEVAEHSAAMTRKLARDYKNMLIDAQKRGKGSDGTYTIIDPVSGQRASVSEERLGKEIKNANKELGKTDNIFKKIKESFTKGEDGIVDWVGGIENIGEAIGQVGDLVNTIGDVYDMFGNPNEYDATSEAIHDIATTMQGVNTAAQGIGQIASGDYIGGAMSVISGLSSAIGAWFDNDDNKIVAEIKESEMAVKRLEVAYVDLQHAMDKAYGASIVGAKRAAASAKQLELEELKRQLRLEKSRDSKHRDESRIYELEKQIKELRYEIEESIRSIVDDLLGTDVGSFAENLVSSMIESFKKGEDYMKVFNDSFDNMIDNMIMKSIVSRVVSSYLDSVWDSLEERINNRSKKQADAYAKAQAEYDRIDNMSDDEVAKEMFGGFYGKTAAYFKILSKYNGDAEKANAEWQRTIDEYRDTAKAGEKTAKANLDAVTKIGDEDINYLLEILGKVKPELAEGIKAMLEKYYHFGQDSDKQLSALQQGISGITEDTAGALEAYMNGVSQQVYLQSDILTQIRDAVVSFEVDVQVATMAQILLQLQVSYQMQQNIYGIMNGWSNPSGTAVKVEMI